MSVVVDHEAIPARQLGLHTVGQVLSHLQTVNRLVVHVLIDGEEPDLGNLSTTRKTLLDGHTLFIETADPTRLALDVLSEVEEQLQESDRLKGDAADLLRQNQSGRALEKLSGCFTIWQNAQESLLKTAQLLRIDLEKVLVKGIPVTSMLKNFSQQLREITTALKHRDFVTLSDILLYETTQTTEDWAEALESMRATVQSLR